MKQPPEKPTPDWAFIAYEIALEAEFLARETIETPSTKSLASYKFAKLNELVHYPFKSLLNALLSSGNNYAKAVVLRPFKVNQSSNHEWTVFWGESLNDSEIAGATAIAESAKLVSEIKMSTEVIEDRKEDFLKPYILLFDDAEVNIPHREKADVVKFSEVDQDPSVTSGKIQMLNFAKAVSACIVITIPAWTKIKDEDVKSGTMIIYGSASFPMESFWQIVTAYHSGGLMYLGTFEQQKHLALQRSHEMLLKLQRPLDALTKAFNDVHAEAQEMQAILNDPEEGLFKAHKLLAPLFQDGHEVEVSKFLSVTAYHNWEYDSEHNTHEVLQRAYCYAVCSIFGIEKALSSAQSQAALVQLARNALKDARIGGVFSKLITTVELVLSIKANSLEESVLLDVTADTAKEGGRFQQYLQTLKRVCFTPFKEFGSKWPNAPAQLAALGGKSQAVLNSIECTLEPLRTPFAQHAILTFILEAKSFLRQEAKQNDHWGAFKKLDIEPASTPELKEYKLQLQAKASRASTSTWEGDFYCATKDKRAKGYGGDLHECLKAAIRFGVVGRNVGNFHGIFQNLIRHGLGVTHYPAKTGSWVLLKPSASHPVIAAFGKLKAYAQDEMALCSADCSHYFAIIESDVDRERHLRIVWSEDKNDLLGNSAQNCSESADAARTSETTSTTNAESRTSPPVVRREGSGKAEYHPVIVLDHDANTIPDYRGAWFNSISIIPELKRCVTAQYEGAPNSFSTPAGDQKAIVVLHTGNDRGQAWESKLKDDSCIVKVIVVSTGGDPASKNIIEQGKFFHCAVKPGDLEDGNRRQPLLMHIRISQTK